MDIDDAWKVVQPRADIRDATEPVHIERHRLHQRIIVSEWLDDREREHRSAAQQKGDEIAVLEQGILRLAILRFYRPIMFLTTHFATVRACGERLSGFLSCKYYLQSGTSRFNCFDTCFCSF